MLFFGMAGDREQPLLHCALIAVRGESQWDVIFQHQTSTPAEIAPRLAAVRAGGQPSAGELGQLHTLLGMWMGDVALAALRDAGVSPQSVELAGCQPFGIPGGLALGDLARATQASGLVIAAVDGAGSGADSGVECAVQAWRLWQRSRQLDPDGAQTNTVTEGRNPATLEIDRLPTLDMLRLINREDERVARAVGSQLAHIAAAVDRVTERMQRGGRMIYIGAGTSGRLGVLDASEIPPTYGTSPDLIPALIAGGETAIRHSLEGVEDDAPAGAAGIASLNTGPLDTVVGIAASGRTPYVLGALAEARRRGALTVSIACNSPAPVEDLADIAIAPLVGPEAITGSTRMKAGTAQKLALNMLSTAVMIRLGKTYSNLMVDMQASNIKLHQRARRIVAQACGISEEAAGAALQAAGGEVKTAIVAVKAGIAPEEARERLARSGGRVRMALEFIAGGGA